MIRFLKWLYHGLVPETEPTKPVEQKAVPQTQHIVVHYISIPRAMANAYSVGIDAVRESKDAEKFQRFINEELRRELERAEVRFAMFDNCERNSWMSNPRFVKMLNEALGPEGFEANFYIPEDGQHLGRMFIHVKGRKE